MILRPVSNGYGGHRVPPRSHSGVSRVASLSNSWKEADALLLAESPPCYLRQSK